MWFLVASATIVEGQTIRGRVTDAEFRSAVPGVLVTLHDAERADSANPLRLAVTNERGEFLFRLTEPGRVRLTARRIGVRPHSQILSLEDGETRHVEIALEALSAALPVVVVRDSALCVRRGDRADRVAALLDAVRTALTIIRASDADTMVSGRRLVRYSRTRNASSYAITSETIHSYDSFDLQGDVLFSSPSALELSLGGYWRVLGGDSLAFFAPDADALLSPVFLRNHCFDVTEGNGEHKDRVGLTFEPVSGRVRGEVSGVLWLDRTNHELQSLDVRWRGLPPELNDRRVGGEVHYSRLPTGAWIVKRWSLVMPQPGMLKVWVRRGEFVEHRGLVHLREDGGMLMYPGSTDWKPGSVSGEVVGTDGGPLRWSTVRVVGFSTPVVVDSAGRFRFDSVPPGPHVIVVEHPQYEAFGQRAAEVTFLLDEGGARHIAVRTLSDREVGDNLCPGRNWRWATLRATLLDSAGTPLANTHLALEWLEMRRFRGPERALIERMVEVRREDWTDSAGVAVFCSVAPGRELTLNSLEEGRPAQPVGKFKLGNQQNKTIVLRVNR
jgi:hypothetical protein